VIGEAGTTTALSATSSQMAAEAYNSDLEVLAVKSHDGSFKVLGDQGAQAGDPGIQWYPSFPNPFNKETTIRFELPETRQMQFTISDLRGTVVSQFAGVFEEGMHEVKWDGTNQEGRALAAGTYVMRIDAGSDSHTYRLVYIRE
jgi:flagellar hook assembly protein FlgD